MHVYKDFPCLPHVLVTASFLAPSHVYILLHPIFSFTYIFFPYLSSYYLSLFPLSLPRPHTSFIHPILFHFFLVPPSNTHTLSLARTPHSPPWTPAWLAACGRTECWGCCCAGVVPSFSPHISPTFPAAPRRSSLSSSPYRLAMHARSVYIKVHTFLTNTHSGMGALLSPRSCSRFLT